MKKTLILLAGCPGTGKSYLNHLIRNRIACFQTISPDDVKERNWDLFGFDNLNEKDSLTALSWREYDLELEEWLKRGANVISDYPFSCRQRDRLEQLTDKYHYQVITVRLICDLNVLFERQKKRDFDQSRHPGHIVSRYHKGMCFNRSQADNLLTKEEFFNRCLSRGYQTFSLGKLYELDVTDYSKADYDTLLKNISEDTAEGQSAVSRVFN